MDLVLAAMDTDGGGAISAVELKQAPASLLKLDTDGDGKIGRAEAGIPRGAQ